ncbi:MAG: response regulator transcription factor [Nocardioides sp.]
MIRVLVVDDQTLVREGFQAILDGQPDCEVVATAKDGVDAVEQTLRLAPDVVLMDIRMPRLDGVEATRRICSDQRWTGRVIVLTTYGADEYVWDALHAGASGFLLKTTTAGDLVHAVRCVAAGTELLAPDVTRRLVRQFMAQPRPGESAPGLAELSERERQVFEHLANGLSNAEIASTMFLSEATVKTHINRLFAKLGVRDRVQAVIFAYESGSVSPGRRGGQ